jgi:hypothetical protein
MSSQPTAEDGHILYAENSASRLEDTWRASLLVLGYTKMMEVANLSELPW